MRARFPEALEPLSTIVNNLRWSWHPESQDLLESVDPDLWRQCHGDPRKMLGEVSAERLDRLATDRKFLRRLSDVADDLADYVSAPRAYQRRQAERSAAPVIRDCVRIGHPARRDRLLLARVRHHRGASAVLGRSGHSRR